MATKPTAKQLLALVDSFDWEKHNKDLATGMKQIARDLVETAGGEIHGDMFDTDDPFIDEHLTKYVGSRITQLTATTKDEVSGVLRRALANGEELSIADLQTKILDTVRAKFEDYEAFRALRIARTETATVYNVANVLGERQAGAEFVTVLDGDGGDCAPCAAANGQKWTIEQALENPLQHPNCRRAFMPYVEEASADKIAKMLAGSILG